MRMILCPVPLHRAFLMGVGIMKPLRQEKREKARGLAWKKGRVQQNICIILKPSRALTPLIF